mmetsp:Transcript_26421/g.43260  ORF Transcript_26421/g.43260 Transcript_26421/m.43260 type:complete len:274 (+) Transcript_26421:155-976(+)|eukprot:CAMPEP_0184672398 /NCGR_PEP_ID=MMETSP0308-20130426/86076_1 /TAXON_ID=38269 /ORGANISM="Gloeochaete witrockiana, Strain SAG 46.84" /LENGTH=273 /DNA_ID=CAMNT_0027119721 /DNA_START=71 /DNA_END=892 /DNA_ORIENTATION=-
MIGAKLLRLQLSNSLPRLLSTSASQTPAYFILGATGGVGSALARQLSQSGAGLFLAGRSSEKLEALKQELGANNSDVATAVIDPTKFEQVEGAMKVAAQQFGKLSGAANCIGSLILKPAHMTSEADLNATMTINLNSAFALVRGSVATMGSTGGGSIVLCSSAVAKYGAPNHEAIAAAKAAVVGLALSAAATYASKNIRINCVAPGLTRTPLTARITSKEASLKASEAMHPLGRIGEAEEVARMIAFLLQPENSFITGQVIAVDGGLSTLKPR